MAEQIEQNDEIIEDNQENTVIGTKIHRELEYAMEISTHILSKGHFGIFNERPYVGFLSGDAKNDIMAELAQIGMSREDNTYIQELIYTFGAWLIDNLVVETTVPDRMDDSGIIINRPVVRYITPMIRGRFNEVAFVHEHIARTIYDQIIALTSTGSPRVPYTIPRIDIDLRECSSFCIENLEYPDIVECLEKLKTYSKYLVRERNYHIVGESVVRELPIGPIVTTLQIATDELEQRYNNTIRRPAQNQQNDRPRIQIERRNPNIHDIVIERRRTNRDDFVDRFTRMMMGMMSGVVSAADDESDDNILETVADESFNEARQNAINKFADSENEVFIGNKSIKRTDEMSECLLCCAENPDYICGHPKCGYVSCKDCIARLCKTTGKCPNCQGMLILSPIVD